MVRTCAEVTFDMAGEGFREPSYHGEVGDLLWNPKAGEGHVLMREVPCDGGKTADCGCGGWGSQPCPSISLICECGEDSSYRDHHYVLLARSADADAG
jgi:hypothetical protein